MGTTQSIKKATLRNQQLKQLIADSTKDSKINKNKKYLVDFSTLTDKQKYFTDLVIAKTRKEVIELALEGVDLDNYNIYTDKEDDTHEYFVMVPKNATGFLPMLMAHTDVHPNITSPTRKSLYFKDGIFSGKDGLGADDRAGIYTINQVLREYPSKFIVGFFDKEEIGCIGSSKFAASSHFKQVNEQVSCYISIDRRRGVKGEKHIATYGYNNEELFTLIKDNLNRDTISGSITDCSKLSAQSSSLNDPVACFNFSCGYANEHRNTEQLYWNELEETVSDVKKLTTIPELWQKKFKFVAQQNYKTTFASRYHRSNRYFGYTDYYRSQYDEYDYDDYDDYDDYYMYLTVDGVKIRREEIKKLQELICYFTGSVINLDELNDIHTMYILKIGDKVKLKPNIPAGNVVKNTLLVDYLVNKLKNKTWTVKTVYKNDLFVDLVTTNSNKIVVPYVPMQWLSKEPINNL